MAKFSHDTRSVVISKCLVLIFGLAKSAIIARWLGVEGSGLIAGLLVYPSIFMSFGSLGIRQSVALHLGKGTLSDEQVRGCVLVIWMLSSVISSGVSFLLIRNFTDAGEFLLAAVLATLAVPFTLFNTYNTGIFLAKNEIKKFNRVNWVPAFVVLLCTVIGLVLFDLGIEGALLATALGPLVATVRLLFMNGFLHVRFSKVDMRPIAMLLKTGLVYALALLVINLNYKADIIMLEWLSTSAELGIYSKGAHIIEYLWHIPMVVSAVVFARSVSAKDKLAFSRKVVVLMQFCLVVVSASAIVIAFLANPICTTLFGEGFKRSGSVVQVLAPGVVLLTLYKVANMDMAGRGKPWLSSLAMLPALAVNFLLNVFLIPKYGAGGAAFASTMSYSLAGLIFMLLYCREVGIPLHEALIPQVGQMRAFIRPSLEVVS